MNLARRLREAALVLALLSVSVLVLRANRKQPWELSWLDRAVLFVTAPVEGLFTGAIHALSRGWNHYLWLVDARQESDRLRAENQRLRAELDKARLAESRVARLEGTLGLRAQVPADLVAARVIAVDTSPYYRVLRLKLDRGQGEVKPDMVVIAPEGVVGRVGRVFGGYCEVRLAVDGDSAIDVAVPRSGARGVLKGQPGEEAYAAVIPNMPRSEDVREGDEVVTSGIGGFPRDLPVGLVSRVARPDSGLWQRVEVRPAVDFGRLAEVLVVLSAPPPPDPDFKPEVRRAPPPSRGLSVPR